MGGGVRAVDWTPTPPQGQAERDDPNPNRFFSAYGGGGTRSGFVLTTPNRRLHPLWPLRPSIYPIRIDSVSRFESKSFRRNILESNAGEEGVPISAKITIRVVVVSFGLALRGMRRFGSSY